MKILLANKFYYSRGGDCIYTISLEHLLLQNGHDVAIFAMQHSENLPTQWSNNFPSEVNFMRKGSIFETVLRPLGTREVKNKFNALLDRFQPDVVHLNNIHTQISPVIAELTYERDIRVVWTIHDYKLLCPRYDCLRNGKVICEKCFADKKNVLKYFCMKNSKLASCMAYIEAMKWSCEKLEKYTDIFICPSAFMAKKMIQGGFDKNKIVTLCNFIDIEKTKRVSFNREDYYCYVGRLSPEKGIETLIEVAKQLPYKLKVVGGGALLDKLRQSTKNGNVEFLGYKIWDEIKNIVGNSRFSIISSEWYENNPLSVIESQCLGTPVLGADIGGIPELIDNEKTGMLFESKNANDLAVKIKQMFATKFDYKTIAEKAQERYAAENYYKKILEIYGE